MCIDIYVCVYTDSLICITRQHCFYSVLERKIASILSKYEHEMLLTAKIVMKHFEIGTICFQLTKHIVYCSRLTALTTVDVLRRQAKGAAPHSPMTSI